MKLIGNILWILFGGFLTSIEYVVMGIGFCLSIIGIPWGFQCFKLALVELFPFQYKVYKNPDSNSGLLHMIMNVVWFFIGGIWIALTHLFLGFLLMITIIGIPFAKQHFKLMRLSLSPFGMKVEA